jgi:hypothetical protein
MKRVACALTIGACALGVAASPALAAAPVVFDANADQYLSYSSWAYANHVTSATCKGTGPAHTFAGGFKAHSRFTCKVDTADGTRGIAISAKALGPEWLKVTQVSGGLAPDAGVGAVPSGPQILLADEANTALQNSAWASSHEVDEVFCSGIGPHKGEPYTTGYLSGAFDCATLSMGRTGPQVIIKVESKSKVSVTRTFPVPAA